MCPKKADTQIVAVILSLVPIGGSVGLYALSVSIYDGSFNYRCTTADDMAFDISEFPEMTRQRHTFTSNHEQTLVGYLYAQVGVENKAVVVFAHGLGAGGQTGYCESGKTVNGHAVSRAEKSALFVSLGVLCQYAINSLVCQSKSKQIAIKILLFIGVKFTQ